MKTFFRSISVAGVLAFCISAFAAEVPRGNAAPAASSLILHFTGAQRISEDAAGALEIFLADGTLLHYRPDLYQVVNGKRREVRFNYHFVDADHVELKAVHPDPSSPLRIEPARGAHTNS